MWTKSSLAAFALQSLIAKAAAGVVKRAEEGPVTLTRTVTHQSYYGADGSATAVVDTETIVPTSVTSIIDGTTIWVDTTITIGCSLCEAASSASLAEVPAVSTTDNYDYTTTGVSGSASEAGSTASTAEGEATTSVPYGVPDSTPSSVAEEETSTDLGSATGVGSTVISTPSIILSTGGSDSTPTPGGIYTNTTVAVGSSTGDNSAETQTGDNSAETETGDNSAETETGGLVVTQTVTRDGSVSTEVSTVTQTISQPVIIVIRQVTIFTFTFALGGNCPIVKHHSSGDGFVVGEDTDSSSETFTGLGEACSSACYKQFKKCALAAGKNFDLSDCETQLSVCLGSAATHTSSDSSAETVTQSVVLPSDATSSGAESSYIGTGVTVISTRTLTVSEVCTVGSSGVGIITVPSATGGVTSAATTASTALGETTESVPMVETTTGITVSYVNEQGSTVTSYSTMTLTVPCTKCLETQTGETEVATTATSDNSAETTPGTGSESSHISIITLTNTVPNSNGEGSTVIYSESTFVVPTGTETGPYGTGINTKTVPAGETSVFGSQTGETEVATTATSDNSAETTPGTGSESSHISVITLTNTVPNGNGGSTVVYSESTFAIPTGTETGPYGTGISTKTVPAGEESTVYGSQTGETGVATSATSDNSAETPAPETTEGAITTDGSVTGHDGQYSTSLITMSVPASGTHPATISVITMTLSGSYTATGTGEVTQATETAVEVTTGGNSGETGGNGVTYVTMTMSPTCSTCTGQQTVITITGESESTQTGESESTKTNQIETNIVTVTMGGSTGVITVTNTAVGQTETETVTAPGSTETVYVTQGTETVTVTGSSGDKTVTVTGSSGDKTVTVTGGKTETVYVTQTGSGGDKTITITGSASVSTVTVTQNCSNGECSEVAQTATVTAGGDCSACAAATITVTSCPVSEAAATTLATATSKARETVYVTQTVNQAVNTAAPAKWRRMIGF